jgi:hypothetical protein
MVTLAGRYIHAAARILHNRLRIFYSQNGSPLPIFDHKVCNPDSTANRDLPRNSLRMGRNHPMPKSWAQTDTGIAP